MPPVVIENPILNAAFTEPSRHFKFDDDGITDEIVEARRPSSYFVPIAATKKRGGQQAFETEWTQDRVEENRFINPVRERVSLWRQGGHQHVTPTTRRLLQYWSDPERERPLLKKTGAGNLFMVFGEPDITIKEEDGQLTVEIRGVDVYDPTTGEVRSSSTDDIACWFVDTDYNGESFFVRHAYFTGAGDPYQRLKRALKTEIDEAAWASLYSTTSRPFPTPSTGKVAVKVVNHYGDEVMQVYKVTP